MNKSSRVEACMDSDLKQAAEGIFTQFGVSPSEAIRIFYKQVALHQANVKPAGNHQILA